MFGRVGLTLAHNGWQIGVVGEIEVGTFNFALMFDRSTDLEFSC
ncbi:MAG TPA: hypothetical protein PKA15_08960 [Chitinophagales bacterium]|nr:hypothetical protein [Chitinophagales bacterium]HMW94775.1 hypothetical protein [Chitinophagales bacterium]HMY42693.1 hypothetical protein [Chitinophagales bacterium]HMZ94267.1 hypothetical protein [Chitinophagales bacterium]HNB39246.1 hypothetical protein [Chitinophagales bacterium]